MHSFSDDKQAHFYWIQTVNCDLNGSIDNISHRYDVIFEKEVLWTHHLSPYKDETQLARSYTTARWYAHLCESLSEFTYDYYSFNWIIVTKRCKATHLYFTLQSFTSRMKHSLDVACYINTESNTFILVASFISYAPNHMKVNLSAIVMERDRINK